MAQSEPWPENPAWEEEAPALKMLYDLERLNLAYEHLRLLEANEADALSWPTAQAGAAAFIEEPCNGQAFLDANEQLLHEPGPQALAA
jgi:hypothetical protein